MLHSLRDKNSGKVLFSFYIFLPILLLEHLSFSLHIRYFYLESCCRQEKEAVISQLDPRKCSRYCPQVQCGLHAILHSSWRPCLKCHLPHQSKLNPEWRSTSKEPCMTTGLKVLLSSLSKVRVEKDRIVIRGEQKGRKYSHCLCYFQRFISLQK